MKNIYELSDDLNINAVGAKAFNLSKLFKANIKVPYAIVLSKNTFDVSQQELETLLSPFMSNFTGPYVMVRSSAIGEDSSEASFAGQLDSYQCKNNLTDICQDIKKCWRSLANKRVQTYSEQQHKSLTQMAVIVQQMIEPDFAGVLFTTSPIDQEGMYIEYVKGHGDKLVQGEVTPTSIKVNNLNTINEISDFDLKILLEESVKILKLYDMAAQDIEWAYKDKQFYFVQSRSITTIKNKLRWSNTNVNENYPNKLSPLLYSIAKQSYYHYYKNLSLKLGIVSSDESNHEDIFANAIGSFNHHMYYNMTSIHKMIELSPFADLLQSSFDNFVGYQKEHNIEDKTFAHLKKYRVFMLMFFHFLTLKYKVKKIEMAVKDFSEQGLKQNSFSKTIKSYHRFLFIRFQFWYHASFADLYAMLTHGLLNRFVSKMNISKDSGLANGLIQGIPNLVSNRPLVDLWELRSFIYQDQKYQSLFSMESSQIWQRLNKDTYYTPLKEKIETYLKLWGYRCPEELTFFSKNYIEDPEIFIQMLKNYVNTDQEDPKELMDIKGSERQVLIAETSKKISQKYRHNIIKSLLYPIVLKVVVKATMFSISCRERVRLKQAQMYYTFKSICLKIAEHLVKKEILKVKEDIFYLEYQEITRLTSGEEADKEYTYKLIELRKQSMAATGTTPDNFISFQEDLGAFYQDQDSVLSDSSKALKGLPACHGLHTGPVVVVKDIGQIDKIKKGDILVTRQTDPGWISVFPMVSAIIVERGGVLSHSAIVAREFGIPAVVGVYGVTNLLKDGQQVEVNGNTGEIKCLS